MRQSHTYAQYLLIHIIYTCLQQLTEQSYSN